MIYGIQTNHTLTLAYLAFSVRGARYYARDLAKGKTPLPPCWNADMKPADAIAMYKDAFTKLEEGDIAPAKEIITREFRLIQKQISIYRTISPLTPAETIHYSMAAQNAAMLNICMLELKK